jgi:hypothetical protein
MLKVKISMCDQDKQVTRTFSTEKPVTMSDQDKFIKACVSKVLEDFDTSPKKIKIVCSMEM